MGLLHKAITVNPSGFSSGEARGAQVSAAYPNEVVSPEDLRDSILRYWPNSPCQGIVLGPPEYLEEAGFEKFFAAADSMSASFGKAVGLPSKNILILFSKTLDRELLTHRLTKSLKTRVVASFEAGSPEEALSRIQSCL
ncbi:MAG: hypothetical protein LBH70_05655 [Spirochaetaceae bacterium]|jgi:hypothetical protein|nr:hypothetical protein [Spirochaetaceae bacterium]